MHLRATDAEQILNKVETASLIGVSVSTLDRMVKRGDFPKPLRLSLRRVGWPLSVVLSWIASRPNA